jgi:hypothetical protein
MPVFSCLLILFANFFHPFYVSVLEVEYIPKDRQVGISCKVFSDDLEITIKKFSGKDADILKGDKMKNDELLKGYFAAHLSMMIDGKTHTPKYLGYENDKEATWIYFEVKNINPPERIEIITDLLYEYQKSQQNIIHCIIDRKRQSLRLQYPDKKAGFSRN